MKDPIFEVASANYRDEHRLFAQMIMSRGVVDVNPRLNYLLFIGHRRRYHFQTSV